MGRKSIIKSQEQIDNIAVAGKYLTELLLLMRDAAKPGIALIEIEEQADRFMTMNNLQGSFKGYQGFPANLCLSVNACLVHGIPDQTVLKNGDLLKIDAGVTYKGCIADSALSLIVGGDMHNKQGAELIKTTKLALDLGVGAIKPGDSMLTYATTVHKTMEDAGFTVIKDLTGHGVGVSVHEAPSIFNRPAKEMKKQKFLPGMVIALEPITAIKSKHFIHGTINNRNLYTQHGDLGAQREYTLAIGTQGVTILAGVQ